MEKIMIHFRVGSALEENVLAATEEGSRQAGSTYEKTWEEPARSNHRAAKRSPEEKEEGRVLRSGD